MLRTCAGTLELVAGPMYSGKTTYLLRRLFTEAEIGLRTLYINHSCDDRSRGPFSTHNPLYKEQLSSESKVDFASGSSIEEVILSLDKDYDVFGVDEAQFFPDLYDSVKYYVEQKNKHFIVVGLNGDFRRETFGQLLSLEPISDSYKKITGFCKICAEQGVRNKSIFTKKINGDFDQTTDVGGKDKYLPVCRKCYLE